MDRQLLAGFIPTHLLMNQLPETVCILHTLAAPALLIPQASSPITPDEFISTYKNVHENTLSPPSGHLIGHCKAVLKDPTLVAVYSNIMSLAFLVGFAPNRWRKISGYNVEKRARKCLVPLTTNN
jgi:hypothetical protein